MAATRTLQRRELAQEERVMHMHDARTDGRGRRDEGHREAEGERDKEDTQLVPEAALDEGHGLVGLTLARPPLALKR